MLLPFTLEALCALRGWGIVFIFLKKLFLFSWRSCFYFLEEVVYWNNFFYWTSFSEQVVLLKQFLFLLLTKNQKKPLAVFIINTKSLWKVSIIWYLSWKKDGTCRGKITLRWYLSWKNLEKLCFQKLRNDQSVICKMQCH